MENGQSFRELLEALLRPVRPLPGGCYTAQPMRRALPRLLVLVLALALTPGLTEAAENLWHLATAGHGAHSLEHGEDHAPEGAEHGCTGTFHLCSCHHTPPSALAAPATGAPAPEIEVRPARNARGEHPDPYLGAPERPPRIR